MKTVLLLTDVNFWERSSGNRERIYNLVKYLAPRVKLTVVNTGPAPRHQENALKTMFNAEFHILEPDQYLSSSGYGRRLKKWLGSQKFEAVIIEYIHSSYFLNYLAMDATVFLDAHDIISDRAEEFRKFNYAGTLYELSAETESEILQLYDHIIAICDADAQTMQALAKGKNILVCPHPVTPLQATIRKEVKNIVYIASTYIPNVDAINHFISNCWADISRLHSVRLLIYGTVCEEVNTHGHRNIVLKGFVPDTGNAYHEADIIINPVRFGAGLKIKNLEALGHGLPLVTTSHGARGLDEGRDQTFMIADTPEDFIKAVISLISDEELRIRLSISAINYMQSNFTADRCYAPLMNAISCT